MDRLPFDSSRAVRRRLDPRRIGAFTLLLLGCLGLGSCIPAVPHPATIKIGGYAWPGNYWVDIAWKKGWFAAAGLDVQRFDFNRKYFAALDALVSGGLDVLEFSQFQLVRKVAEGHDLVAIAAVDYSTGAEALVVRPGVHHLSDLKGKRLSLHRGTYLEYLLAIVADREGFDLSTLVMVDQPGASALEDFKAGRVDAMLVWEPYVTGAIAVGGQPLFTASDFPGLTYSVLGLHHEFIERHPDEVAALLGVWRRGQSYLHEHPDESFEIVAQVSGYPVQRVRDLMRTVRVLDLTDNARAFSYAAGFASLHGAWRNTNDFMMDSGLVAARVDSPAHLDSGFVRRLE